MLPKFYLFDKSLPGELEVVFNEHVMHADNMREHLEGFSRTPEDEFTLHGTVTGNTILYANGDVKRMRDGVVLLFNVKDNQTLEVGEWVTDSSLWPKSTEELDGYRIRIPGRWLTKEESATKWLGWQGIEVKDEAHLHSKEIGAELEKRGIRSLDHFVHPGLEARSRGQP